MLLAACGGGGGGGGNDSRPPLAGDYFPANTGDTWTFSGDEGLEIISVTGQVQSAGQSATRLLTTDANGSALYADYYRFASDGVWSVALESESATTKALYTFQLLRLPLRVGDVWTQPETTTPNSSVDFDNDGIGDKMENRIAFSVLSVESVATPVGLFDNCARVQQIDNRRFTMSSTGRPASGRIVTDRWFAPGIGLVRTATQVTYEGQTTRVQNSILQAYRVGTLHSQGAPSIGGTGPMRAP